MNDESRAAASAVSLVKLLTTGQVTPHEPLDVVSARCGGQSGDQCVCAARIMNRIASQTYDLLLCPATIVPPFPVRDRYVAQCNGVDFAAYID